MKILFLLQRIKRETGGIYKKVCRCGERLRTKDGGGESLSHTRWIGNRGYLRRGKWIGGEKFVSGRGEWVCVKFQNVIDVKVDT
jgi:hypothetical protein